MEAVPARPPWRVKVPTAKPLPLDLEGLTESDTGPISVRIRIVQNDLETDWTDGAMGFEKGTV